MRDSVMIGEVWAGRSGAHEWRTSDPSASPDFLSRVAASVQLHVVLFRENHISGRW
jgi:hypothetical protein